MNVDVVPTGCGDRTVSGAEQCDDGNTANGDGCSATCMLEPLANANACPGHAINLVGAAATETRRATATIDTSTRPNKTGSMCGGSGPEGVFAITSDVDGLLQVKATAGFAALVHARTTCATPATEIPRSCSGLTTFTTTVTKNVPTYVYVDGVNGAAGVAKLDITVTP
jgi:cysteine-rich repeat protein